MSYYLYLDIETIPTDDPAIIASIAETITPPGNISKPETIDAWKTDKKPALVAEAVAKTALSGRHGRICCIGWAWGEGVPKSTLFADDEKTTLNSALARIAIDAPEFSVPVIIGHNVAGFDIRFIWQRAFALGVKLPPWFPRDPKPWSADVFDTMAAWAGPKEFISLDNLCVALGLPGKSDVTGADVAGMYARGEYEAIEAYCRSDVERVRNVHRKMRVSLGEAA